MKYRASYIFKIPFHIFHSRTCRLLCLVGFLGKYPIEHAIDNESEDKEYFQLTLGSSRRF